MTPMDQLPPPQPHVIAPQPAPVAPRRRSSLLYLSGVVLVLAAVAGAFYAVRNGTVALASARATMEAEAARGPRLVVATVAQGPQGRTLQLLGDAKPYSSATLFAKVSGYLRTVAVDKGDLVSAGQVVAEIESAELESQFQSAQADLDNKTRLALRARELLRGGNTAQQTAEQAETNLRMAQELVRNLGTMRSYQQLRAPFDGTVIARFADPGALIQAATTNQSSSLPVMQIADNSRLRIGAYVEQRDVSAIRVGDEAEIVDASNPERRRKARISRSAGTLDPRTRTLFIEIDLDNRDAFLVPGSFVYVALKVPMQSYPQIPVAALLQRGGVQQVAIVGEDATVRFRPVRVVSTDGIVINVGDGGVKAGEKVGLNVSNDVTEGARVRVAGR